MTATVSTSSPTELPPGLAGVVVADTAVGAVRGREGFWHYRDQPGPVLAREQDLVATWHLLLHGHLPDPAERTRFAAEVASERALSETTVTALSGLIATGPRPLEGLRTAVSLLGSDLGCRPLVDLDPDQRRRDTIRVAARVPTLVAALDRLRRGLDPIEPNPDLDPASDLLRMLAGDRPDATIAAALDTYLVVTADHGFNASTFATRVVASTGADVAAALVAGLGALSGPLHGGAPSRALELLDEVGEPERAEEVLRAHLAAGRRLMGFGHRVYRTEDPRAALLRDVAVELGGDRVAVARAVERTAVGLLAEHRPGRDLDVNVEFWAGVVLERLGLHPDLFTPMFAVSRMLGWSAHLLEQAADGHLIRPSARYVGPPPAA